MRTVRQASSTARLTRTAPNASTSTERKKICSEVMASFESVYTVFVILVMIVAGLSSAVFLVWRFRTQAPLLIHVTPETKVQPWPRRISALGFYKTCHENQNKYQQDGWWGHTDHTSHVPAEMKSTISALSTLACSLQISKMPKLLEHVQIFRPKAPPRIPSALPQLQLCSPKLNQNTAPLAPLDPLATKKPARSTLVIVESRSLQSPKRPRETKEMKESEPEPILHPKCPQDTEEIPAWPQVASSDTTRLLAESDDSQLIDLSPKQPIKRKMENSCNVFFAKISLDGHGEPLDFVPQPVKTHRVPKRVIFIEPNIGSFPRHLEQIPALLQPALPQWPPKLRPMLWPTESLMSELNTPATPEPRAPTIPKRVKQPRPVLPPLWPREGPWWTFGRS